MRFRFSLRFLLILMVVGAVGSLLAYQFYLRSAPQRLAAELQIHGAKPIVFDMHLGEHLVEDALTVEHLTDLEREYFAGLCFPHAKSSRALFVASQVHNAKTLHVGVHDPEVSAKHCDFSHLESLTLGGFSASQLSEWLDVADQLEELYLIQVDQLSVTACKKIAASHSLKRLYLNEVDLSTVELAALKELPNLEHLGLFGCEIRGDALLELKQFPKLTSLRLYGTTYDDQTIEGLREVTNITDLMMDSSNVTDRGVALLAKMSHLRELDLNRCSRLTTRCVPDLVSMAFLDWLSVLGTAVEKHPDLDTAEFMTMDWIL